MRRGDVGFVLWFAVDFGFSLLRFVGFGLVHLGDIAVVRRRVLSGGLLFQLGDVEEVQRHAGHVDAGVLDAVLVLADQAAGGGGVFDGGPLAALRAGLHADVEHLAGAVLAGFPLDDEAPLSAEGAHADLFEEDGAVPFRAEHEVLAPQEGFVSAEEAGVDDGGVGGAIPVDADFLVFPGDEGGLGAMGADAAADVVHLASGVDAHHGLGVADGEGHFLAEAAPDVPASAGAGGVGADGLPVAPEGEFRSARETVVAGHGPAPQFGLNTNRNPTLSYPRKGYMENLRVTVPGPPMTSGAPRTT